MQHLMRTQYVEWHQSCMHLLPRNHEADARRTVFAQNLQRLNETLEEVKRNLTENGGSTLLKSLPIDIAREVIDNDGKDNDDNDRWSETFEMYRRLCQMTEPEFSVLPPAETCVFHSVGDVHASLAPFKVEFLAYDPLVAVIHDVLGEADIEEVVGAAGKRGFEAPRAVSSGSGVVGQVSLLIFHDILSKR